MRQNPVLASLLPTLSLCACLAVFPQHASAAVYKCIVDGKVVFSDKQCHAAEEVEQVDIHTEADHRTLREITNYREHPDGTVQIERTTVLPDPDARPGLRSGEKEMLRDLKREERENHYARDRERYLDRAKQKSYSERLKDREREMKQWENENEWRRWRNR